MQEQPVGHPLATNAQACGWGGEGQGGGQGTEGRGWEGWHAEGQGTPGAGVW